MGDLFSIAAILFILWCAVMSFMSAKGRDLGAPNGTAPGSNMHSNMGALPIPVSLDGLPPDIARMIEGLPNRSLDELQKQWINTIGMIDRVGAAKAGPFIVFRSALSAEWGRRLAMAESDPKAFAWPTTTAPIGKGGLDSGDWHLIGMLSYLGYRVGKTAGVSDGIRRQILDLCFDSPLPPINGLDYMRSWGAPSTTARLRKLAHELASFARNGKRKRAANLASAVADWEADLNYLHRRYYVGKFRFAWPRAD